MSDIPERKAVISERSPGRTFDIYEAPQVEHLFAEGTSNMMLGASLTKIEFYRVFGAKQEILQETPVVVEQREIFCVLTMPTAALIEACGSLIEQMGMNMSSLDTVHQQLKQVITNAIQKAGAAKV